MDPSINQLHQLPHDNDHQQSQALTKAQTCKEATLLGYYHHQFDHHHQLVAANANFMQETCSFGDSFNFSAPKLKPKRRKSDLIQVHSSRIVQSSGRKDRHSKVCTSRGPKDRRLRLSPGTAIQFYDVQDRLGYDRPSRAIDWLMKEAKSAIDALETTENHRPENAKIQKMQKVDKVTNVENPVSDFGSFANGTVPSPSTEYQAWPDGDSNSSRKRVEAHEEDLLNYPSYQDGFLSPFDTNLQRIFANSEYSVTNTLPLHFTSPTVSGQNQIFTQREPLQSSFVNYSQIGDEFQGINFYGDEFSTFTDAVKDKIQEISSRPCFQHQED